MLQLVTSTHRRGAETFAVELGEALSERCRSVETVALRAGDGPDTLPVEACRGTSAPARWRELRQRMRHADVVVAHGAATLRAAAEATVPRYRPFVYRTIGEPAYWARTRRQRLGVGMLLRRASAIAVYYPAAATTLRSMYGLRSTPVHVIPKGVLIDRYPVGTPSDRAAARTALGIDPEARVVVIVAALSREKNVGLAIDAVARLDGVELLVVGDGPERVALEQRAAAVSAPVRFEGTTSDPGPYRAAADVNLLTSRTEGVPGSLIEAGLVGLPSVTTDVGGVREVVVDGVSGFVVPARPDAVAGAIAAALDDAGELGATARDTCIERFDMAPVADAWVELLEGVRR